MLANRWRLFLTTIHLEPDKVVDLVLAAICLHNMLRTELGPRAVNNIVDRYDHKDHMRRYPGLWRQDTALKKVDVPTGTNYAQRAKDQRTYRLNYVNSSKGCVPWQWVRALKRKRGSKVVGNAK